MKIILGTLALTLATLSTAARACDPAGVIGHAGALGRAAQHLEQVAHGAVGYAALTLDAAQLAREAQALASETQAGAQCWKIERDFQFISQYVARLGGAHQSAQTASPNTTVQYAWESVTFAYGSLNQAVGSPSPPPPPPTTIVQLECGSSQYKYRFCPVNGAVVHGQLLQQLSSSRCEPGRSFGFERNGVWVDRGCRARFQLRIRQ